MPLKMGAVVRPVVFLCLIAFCVIISAQVVRKGRCPSIPPVRNFDIHKMTGTWYLQFLYYYAPQANIRCSIFDMKVVEYEGSEALEFTERALDKTTGQVVHRTSLKIIDPVEPAKSISRTQTACFNDTTSCEYVAVDYKSYYVIYCCRVYQNGFKYETLGIRTRLAQISNRQERVIKTKLRLLGISEEFMYPVEENCEIYPSE